VPEKRWSRKSSSIGIGFSHESVPSLSKTATRSSGGTDFAALSAKSTIAWVVAVSFHDLSSATLSSPVSGRS
jgi:hypothetical protein